MASLLAQGAVIKTTSLTEEYDFDAHMSRWGKDTIPLFAIDDKNELQVFSTGREVKTTAGWKLVSLVRNGKEADPGSAAGNGESNDSEDGSDGDAAPGGKE